MAKLKHITKFLDKYLEIEKTKESSWNGLQIEGKENIKKIIFAENASMDIFKKSAKEKGDLIIVHHGHFWKHTNPSVRSWGKTRIVFLLNNNISLYASHLPLDKHKEVGNNAQLLKLLGAKKTKEGFGEFEGGILGWIGEFKKPIHIREITDKLNKSLNTKCKVLAFGPQKIKRIAICSGGGGYGRFAEALEKKADLYLTGDPVEISVNAKDARINVIFAGHYATETVGVKALIPILKKKFKVKTLFIDDPTGL